MQYFVVQPVSSALQTFSLVSLQAHLHELRMIFLEVESSGPMGCLVCLVPWGGWDVWIPKGSWRGF